MIILRRKLFADKKEENKADKKEEDKADKKKQIKGASIGAGIGTGVAAGLGYLNHDITKRRENNLLERHGDNVIEYAKLKIGGKKRLSEAKAGSLEHQLRQNEKYGIKLESPKEEMLKDLEKHKRDVEKYSNAINNLDKKSGLVKDKIKERWKDSTREALKNSKRKSIKKAVIPIAIGSAIGLAKSRGELDKDHIKASLSTDPGQIIAGHVGINKGDKALEKNLKEGKTQAQAIRDSSEEAKKESKKIAKITSPVGGAIAGIGAYKALGNLEINLPTLTAIVRTGGKEAAENAVSLLNKAKDNKGKIGAGVGLASTAAGVLGSRYIGNRTKRISQQRLLKKLAEEDDKEKSENKKK